MIEPHLRDGAFLEDIEAAPADRDCFHVWWLGQSGFLLKWGASRLLLDPYLSDSLTRKYAGTERPHIRMTACVVRPGELRSIDAVTSSHNHTDHLDRDTLLPILEGNPAAALVIPEANRSFVAERLSIDPGRPLGVGAGTSVEAAGFGIHGVAAAHESLETDLHGRHRFLGYVVRFGEWTLYHSGDTVLYDGLAEHLQAWRIDVAILPINGRARQRGVAGNLWGREAAALAREAAARVVFPCHYDMFSFNTATPDEFVHECHRLDQPYRVLRCGERWSSFELERTS